MNAIACSRRSRIIRSEGTVTLNTIVPDDPRVGNRNGREVEIECDESTLFSHTCLIDYLVRAPANMLAKNGRNVMTILC